jgi:hypothetical protein
MAKSSCVVTAASAIYDPCEILRITHISSFNKINSETEFMILDDLSGLRKDLQEPTDLIHFVDPTMPADVRIVFHPVLIPAYIPRVIINNDFNLFLDHTRYDQIQYDAIRRRLVVIQLDNSLKNKAKDIEIHLSKINKEKRPILLKNYKGAYHSAVFTKEQLIIFAKKWDAVVQLINENKSLPYNPFSTEETFILNDGLKYTLRDK